MLKIRMKQNAKYQLLISKRESTDLKYLNDPKAFFRYLNDMGNNYENIEECNPNKKRKKLIVFDDLSIFQVNKYYHPIKVK